MPSSEVADTVREAMQENRLDITHDKGPFLPALDEAKFIRDGLLLFKDQLSVDFNVRTKTGGRYESFVKITTELEGKEGPQIKVKLDENIIELNGQPQKDAKAALKAAITQVADMLGNKAPAAPETGSMPRL